MQGERWLENKLRKMNNSVNKTKEVVQTTSRGRVITRNKKFDVEENNDSQDLFHTTSDKKRVKPKNKANKKKKQIRRRSKTLAKKTNNQMIGTFPM